MNDKWSIRIKPTKSNFNIDIKEVWKYRDLYYMYVKRDIITVYKQTILGPIWFLVQPIMTTIMFTFIFGGLAGLSTNGLPQPLFYLSGIVLWNYFSTAFTDCADVFGKNSNIFGKVFFPRLVVPLASITSNLVKMIIQMLLLFGMIIYYILMGANIQITWAIILVPLLVLMVALLAMSWGMIFSSMTVKYRDLKHLITFGIQLFMYATPVIYPLESAPERFRHIIELNPLSSIFEAFKYALTGVGQINWFLLLYSFIVVFISLLYAIMIFNKTEKTFMDTV